MKNLEISTHNLSSGEDGVLSTINVIKAIKISDGGYLRYAPEDECSFLPMDGLKLQEKYDHEV